MPIEDKKKDCGCHGTEKRDIPGQSSVWSLDRAALMLASPEERNRIIQGIKDKLKGIEKR